MNKQAARFIKVGATGRFEWVSSRNEGRGVEITRHDTGAFEIVEVHSNDFVISIVKDDFKGEPKKRVYCSIPVQKKPKTDKSGHTESNVLTWLPDGFHDRQTDARVGGFCYTFDRKMTFNA